MAAMNMVSAVGFSGVSYHLRRCPQGVASALCKKTSIFWSRRSKLDDLTVCRQPAARETIHRIRLVWQLLGLAGRGEMNVGRGGEPLPHTHVVL
jgi:hypothetical protein